LSERVAAGKKWGGGAAEVKGIKGESQGRKQKERRASTRCANSANSISGGEGHYAGGRARENAARRGMGWGAERNRGKAFRKKKRPLAHTTCLSSDKLGMFRARRKQRKRATRSKGSCHEPFYPQGENQLL